MIRLCGVAKHFGDGPEILSPIDFSIENGDFVSFIGPSGCGKSTLLRLVAGLISPSTGEIKFSDHLVGKQARDVGFVFQEPTLLPWKTVEKNVETPLRLRGLSSEESAQRRSAALAQVRLTEKASAYPRQLSGGQKMRVSIARALALQPSVLLMDEPFGALDEMTRDALNEELLLLRTTHDWTTLFVTHSVAEAVFLSNRVVVLAPNPGRIHQVFEIPFAYPRNQDTRKSDDYHHWVVRVSAALRSVGVQKPLSS